jgi:hypothetical protein
MTSFWSHRQLAVRQAIMKAPPRSRRRLIGRRLAGRGTPGILPAYAPNWPHFPAATRRPGRAATRGKSTRVVPARWHPALTIKKSKISLDSASRTCILIVSAFQVGGNRGAGGVPRSRFVGRYGQCNWRVARISRAQDARAPAGSRPIAAARVSPRKDAAGCRNLGS